MHVRNLAVVNVHLNIPTNWNELSIKQLENITHQIHCFHGLVKDDANAMAMATTKLYLQLSKELLRGNHWKAVQKALKEVPPKEFMPFLKFVYGPIDRTKFTDKITIGKTDYHGPDQRLRNCIIGEFSFADAAFYQWKQGQKPVWLDVLCATLFREAATEPNEIDLRRPFIKQGVDARADKFAKAPLKRKLAIAATYEGCRNHIANTFPLIFPKPIKTEGQPNVPQPKRKYISFGEIVLQKIEGDPSKLEATNNTMLYDFLSIVNLDIKNQKK